MLALCALGAAKSDADEDLRLGAPVSATPEPSKPSPVGRPNPRLAGVAGIPPRLSRAQHAPKEHK